MIFQYDRIICLKCFVCPAVDFFDNFFWGSINGGTQIAGCFISWKILLGWMISGYPYFRKPLCVFCFDQVPTLLWSFAQCARSGGILDGSKLYEAVKIDMLLVNIDRTYS